MCSNYIKPMETFDWRDFCATYARRSLDVRDETRRAAEHTGQAARAYLESEQSERDWHIFLGVFARAVGWINDSCDALYRMGPVCTPALYIAGISDLEQETPVFINWYKNIGPRSKHHLGELIELTDNMIEHANHHSWQSVEERANR